MKRWLPTLLTIAILLSFVATPLSAFAKEEKIDSPSNLLVYVPENKEKVLMLSWDTSQKNDGYQVFRSNSGKKGTYKIIATTKKTKYTDTGLKQQTLYFYAVRAFSSKNGKTVFSDFVKDDCYTKITKNYAQKKLQEAYKISDQWIFGKNCDYNKQIEVQEAYMNPDGRIYTTFTNYYLVNSKTITTKAALKKYLSNFFDSWRVKTFVDDFFLEKKGHLYEREWGIGDSSVEHRELAKVRDIVQWKNQATFSVLETWEYCDIEYNKLNCITLSRNGTKLVFSDSFWFPG